MGEFFKTGLTISLVLFMVGNLLAMGLEIRLPAAFAGLRNVRFVILSLLWGFILCPALALLLTRILPLSEPYAVGLLLLGMAPCAPFLPVMVTRARGDLGYAAAFMLLAFFVTIVYMPLVLPFLVRGLSTSAWAIAQPLVLFLLVPLMIGLAIQYTSDAFAQRLKPLVRKVTVVATILVLMFCLINFGKGLLSAVGTFAIAAQIIFFAVATSASYFFNVGLPERERSVLALGLSTRNLGAAFAPLLALPGIDKQSIMMVAVGVPLQILVSRLAARWLGVRAAVGEPVMASSFKRP
jgi:BASS family bile acid:Na+ symporter